MSNTNYDVELNISYDNTYKHYIPTYTVSAPLFNTVNLIYNDQYSYNYFISFDDQQETEMGYMAVLAKPSSAPTLPYWAINASLDEINPINGGLRQVNKYVPDVGVFSKIYFRNPYRDRVTFTASNCAVKVFYQTKAPFEVKLNSEGYIASSNASFKCSTVEKNIPVQYSWSSARVYYKRSTDSTYSYVNGTVSGSWSDITVNTNLSLATGYTYNIYIQATADDGTVANTPVGNFATTDGPAVATCVSPVGVYTNGTVQFVWSHSTSYGTPQYAYDLQYSSNNGGSWTTVANHVVSSVNNRTVTISSAGVYLWRVRTYNTLNQAGQWAQASFINNVPAAVPTNLVVTTKGRPTATWVSTTQAAYQVQVLLNNEVIYDSGAIYTGENRHFINDYFDDTRAYTVRVRIYNSLGTVSDWASTGYQQPEEPDVEFSVEESGDGGAVITVDDDNNTFDKYYLKRNNVLIAQIPSASKTYTDMFAIGLTNYTVVGVTSDDQSDIKSQGFRVTYPVASIVTLAGAIYAVNKRVDSAYEIQTSNEADANKAKFLGDSVPAHYFNKMRMKSFTVSCFDDNGIMEDLLGTVVFYADNFGNGGYCFVTAYDKTDSFVKNSLGIYANEVSLTLEVTNYDDSIEYTI